MEIKLVHVTKSFGAKQVIQPTSFVIQSGSLTTLLGPGGRVRLRQDHPVADDRRTGNAGQR